jgi:DNA-binding transcriptional ArsR family regulator
MDHIRSHARHMFQHGDDHILSNCKQRGSVMARSAHEHRELLERELTKVGLKPRVEATDGGHLRINFTVHGHERYVITAKTPSDHRATLNARARIRQVLRADGYVPPVKETQPSVFTKALSAPPPAEPLHERVEKLEADIDALLDMIVASVRPEDLTRATKVAPVAEAEAPAPRVQMRGTAKRAVLLALEYQWTAYAHITRNSRPMSDAHVSMALTVLKKKGLVERDVTRKGFWRKVIPARRMVNGHALEHHTAAS